MELVLFLLLSGLTMEASRGNGDEKQTLSYLYGLCLLISVSPRSTWFISALRKLWNISHVESLSVDSITTLFSRCSRKLKL